MGPGRFCLVQVLLATDVWCPLSLAISLRIIPTGVMRVNFAVWCGTDCRRQFGHRVLAPLKDLPA